MFESKMSWFITVSYSWVASSRRPVAAPPMRAPDSPVRCTSASARMRDDCSDPSVATMLGSTGMHETMYW